MSDNIHLDVSQNLKEIINLYFDHTGNITALKDPHFSELGAAENNINFLIHINDLDKFVLRVVRDEKRKHRLTREFKVLQLLPEGIAPTAYALDLSCSIIPHSFLLESFLEGDNVQTWDQSNLKLLAKTMAQYHSIKSDFYGDFGSEVTQFNICKFFFDINNSFLDEYPILREDPDIQFALSHIKEFLTQKQYLFDQLHQFRLIHGDLTRQNILAKDESMHILDWEVCSYGDNANDFATFYYDDFVYHNWRIQLNNDEQEIFLNEYLQHIFDPTLKERIKVWLVFDKCCSLIYCKYRLESYKHNTGHVTLSKEQFEAEIDKIFSSLSNFF